MGNGKSAVKVYVDEKNKKVMFAEANEEFVEILFSFLTYPLGTIARMSRKHDSNDVKLGSLSSLYESVHKLDPIYFNGIDGKSFKFGLLCPINSSAHVCNKLKVYLEDDTPLPLCIRDSMFLKKKAKFLITDDLKVVTLLLDTSIALLDSLGVEDVDLLDVRTMEFGSQEFWKLLKWSLLTNNPLTNMVLGENNPTFTNSTISSNSPFIASNSDQTQTVKLLVQKSQNKVLFAQVDNGFVELLLSFLTIPLGAFVRLTKDELSSVAIINLYDSISCLGDRNYLKSEDVKNMLLCPKISKLYTRVTDLLPIYEVNKSAGCFLKEEHTFVVTDDLQVITTPSIATISKVNTPGDMELLEFRIGEQEALFLLNRSLNSTSALTECLEAFRKKPKDHVPNIAFVEDGGRDSEEVDFTSDENNDVDSSFVLID